jgi:hypothetical protein
MYQTGISDLRVVEMQRFELCQSPDMRQPRVAHLSVVEVQEFELR